VGDNSRILPTDTQKNTVYALAREHFTSSIEAFAIILCDHFKSTSAAVAKARIEITEHNWSRMDIDGKPHSHSFINGGLEKHFSAVTRNDSGIAISSGIKDLLILKTTDSGFEGYPKDKFTTLKETSDRIFGTQCDISWDYVSTDRDFTDIYNQIRARLLKTFSSHKSLSVQHTLYAMGEDVLKEFPAVKEIRLKMPNKHHLLANLEVFGMENKNEIFIATDEPYGYITGTITRE